MSKERYNLFSNGTEFMQWQARNCEKCIKAVFYDEKRERWPKYRCAVQKHTEEAAVTDGMGNKRDYDATRSDCPYKQTERKPAWSEEDKRILNRIYRLIAEAADEHAFGTTCRLIGDKECVELQDWLISLKQKIYASSAKISKD